MNLKFLPLGSVCTLDNDGSKLVVIGYKLNEHDYVAVDYPAGYTNANNVRYFNHDQISELYSYGYKDETGKIHLASLDDGTPNAVLPSNDDQVTTANNFGFFFDENGVVVVDTTAQETPEPVPVAAGGGFAFDENGVIIADVNAEKQEGSAPLETAENNTAVSEEVAPVSNNYKFDENGVVVSDKTAPATNAFQFDENGVVTVDETAPLIPSVNNFQFDENGVVIVDNTAREINATDVETTPVIEQVEENEDVANEVPEEVAIINPEITPIAEQQEASEEAANEVSEEVAIINPEITPADEPVEEIEEAANEVPEEVAIINPEITPADESVEEIEEAPIDEEETDTITFNDDGTVSVADDDENSIFGDIPGLSSDELEPVGEALDLTDDVVYAPLSDDIMLSSNPSDEVSFDIPDPEEAVVPSDPAELDTFEDENDEKPEEIEIVEEVKPEKKKRGFFNFGR